VVSRVDRATGARTPVTVGGSPGGLVSAADGFVYVGTGTGSMVKIERRTLAVTPLALAGTSSNVLATVDSLGQAWAIDASGPVWGGRTTAATERFAGSSQGQSPDGDLTGQQFVNVGLAPARWNAIYDATYPTPRWLALRLAANTPTGTTVSVRVRSAASLVDLAAAGWTDWKTVFPLDLSRLNLPSRRYLEIETFFSIIQPGTTPQVSLLAALWAPLENPICLCPDGYVRLGASCVDVDECATNNGGCSENAVCTNTPGGRTCRCKAGFSGDGLVCTDVDECQVANGNCAGDQTCTNTAGGAVCCPRCNAWDTVARACVPSIEFFSAQVAVTTPTVYVRPPGVTSTYFSPTAFAGQATVNTRTPVTYALSGNPAWLSINPTTGVLTGSPTSNGTDPGTRTVTLRATTVCGSSATTTFEVRVVANQWCGDGVVNGNEACDTQSRSCTATNIVGFPAYCQGTYTGVQYCDAACTGYGACTATAPTVSANSFGQCSNAAIGLNNFFCCVMDACRNDSCCGGQNGTNSNLQSGYSQMSFLPNAQGRGNCRLGRSGDDWQVAVSHTTASYRCWR
jgi:hypothetical protein